MTCWQSDDYFSTNSMFTSIILPIVMLVIIEIIFSLYHLKLYILGVLNTIIDGYICMNTEESKEIGVQF